MAYFSYVQFENWSEMNVADWLKGLDDAVHGYIPEFVKEGIDGRKLLMLTHSDLDKLLVTKLGHQELILEGVELLKSMRYTFETENLQHLALQLGCKARSLHNEILAKNGENDPNRANIHHVWHRGQLSISVLSSVCDILSTLKILTSWFDRAPFETIHGMTLLRNSLVKLGLELVNVAQRESGIVEVENAIIKTCQGMTEYCDELVLNSKESLVVQPAALEMATIRKKQGDELGMNIQSSYFGIHVIGFIKEMSPADLCSKVDKGDEVIQVNNQTVLGWQLARLVAALKEKPKEVTMLLKKRPKHTNPYGNVQNKRQMGSRHHVPSVATLPKIMKKRRSKDGEKPPRPTLQEYVTSSVPTGDIYITKESPEDNIDGNDTDNDVFRSGSESPQFTLPVIVDPKQRRATVSGGSPTFERPSLVVEDLDPAPLRPKSQAVNLAEKEAVMAIMHAGDNSLQRKVFEVREKRRLLTAAEDSSVGKQQTTLDSTNATPVEAEHSSGGKQETTVDGTDTTLVEAEHSSGGKQEPTVDGTDSTLFEAEHSSRGKQTTVDGTDTIPVEAEIKAITTSEETTLEKEAKVDQIEVAVTVVTQEEEDTNPETDSLRAEINATKTPSCADIRVSDLELKAKIPSEFQASQELMGKKIWIKQQRVVSAEVAGEDEGARGDQLQLVRIKRLNSQQISDMETKMGDDEVFAKPQKKVGFMDDVAEGEKEESFTHIVVGGVVQKIPLEKVRTNSTNESPQVKMRNKAPTSRTKLDRRVSCKDLGKGDCEGWLYKRKQKDRTLSKHWDKRWCVLKNFNLFYYKNKDDLKAEGVIHLPAFQVSPAPKLKTKKSAFKIHNGGTTFYFASERQDDMSKWMNKMGLAAINYDASQDVTTSGFNKPHKFFTSSVDSKKGYSESEDEDEFVQGSQLSGSVLSLASLGSAQSSLMSGSVLSLASNYSSLDTIMSGSVQSLGSMSSLDTIGGSTDALHSMLRSIQAQDLTIDGKDKVWQRHSQCMTQSLVAAAEQEMERIKRLHSLQRTLKAKELELQEIEELTKKPLTSHNLHSFLETHHLAPSAH